MDPREAYAGVCRTFTEFQTSTVAKISELVEMCEYGLWLIGELRRFGLVGWFTDSEIEHIERMEHRFGDYLGQFIDA